MASMPPDASISSAAATAAASHFAASLSGLKAGLGGLQQQTGLQRHGDATAQAIGEARSVDPIFFGFLAVVFVLVGEMIDGELQIFEHERHATFIRVARKIEIALLDVDRVHDHGHAEQTARIDADTGVCRQQFHVVVGAQSAGLGREPFAERFAQPCVGVRPLHPIDEFI